MREAVAATPGGGRVVVLANGRQTRGEAEAATATARAHDVSVDVVPLPEAGRDAAVTRVQVPEALHAGDPLPLGVNVRSTVAAPATVALYEDGKPRGTRPVNLAAGDNPYLLSLVAGGPGAHEYRVVVRMKGDEGKGNDALDATLRVVRRPRALVVAPGESRLAGDPRRRRHRGHRRDARRGPDHAPPGSAPTPPSPSTTSPPPNSATPAPPRSPTRSAPGETGLVVLGGPHSFSLGGYYSSPLQEALPVGSLKPGNLQRRNLGLEMVLDRSGSMSEDILGVEKMALVRAATHSATAFVAKHHDQFGAIAFDVAPHTVFPLDPPELARRRRRGQQVDRPHPRRRRHQHLQGARGRREGNRDLDRAEPPHGPALRRDQRKRLLRGAGPAAESRTHHRLHRRPRPRRRLRTPPGDRGGNRRPLLRHRRPARTAEDLRQRRPRRRPPGAPARQDRRDAGGRQPDRPRSRRPEAADAARQRRDPAEARRRRGPARPGQRPPARPDPGPVAVRRRPRRRLDARDRPGMGGRMGEAVGALRRHGALRRARRGAGAADPADRPGAEGEVEVDEAEGAEPAAGVGAMEGSIVTRGGEPTPLPLEPRAPWRWTAALPDPRPGVDAFAIRNLGRTSRGLLAVPYSRSAPPAARRRDPARPARRQHRGPRPRPDRDRHPDRAPDRPLVVVRPRRAPLLPRGRRRPPRPAPPLRAPPLRPRSGGSPSADRRADPVASATSTPA